MPLPTTAQLEYTITPRNVSAAQMSAAMQAVPLYTNALTDPTLFGLFGVTVFSDTPTVGPPCMRTIVLTLTPAFFALFPTAASWASAFNGLYKAALEQALAVADRDCVESTVVFT